MQAIGIMLDQVVKNIVTRSFIGDIIQNYLWRKHYRRWIRSGKLIPPPDSMKQATVKGYAKKHEIRVFVETGTYEKNLPLLAGWSFFSGDHRLFVMD